MRFLRWGAFVTWLIVSGLAVAGFAAFSPKPFEPAPSSTPDPVSVVEGVTIDRGEATGRVLALALAMAGRAAAGPIPEIVVPNDSVAQPSSTLADPSADERPRATTAPSTMASTTTTPLGTTTSTTQAQATTTTSAPEVPTVPPGEYQWPNGSTCEASWYGPGFEGRPTASGEPFDPKSLTAAIHDVAFGTFIVVTRVETGDSVTVRVNDRGPFIWDGKWKRHPSRCIDLSQAAMAELGGIGHGVVEVTINY